MKVLPLVVGLVVAVGAAAASSDAREPGSDGVLVAPRVSYSGLSDAGLLLVTPSGRIRRVLRSVWSPVAPARREGPFAVERRGRLAERRPLVVVDGARAVVIPDSAGARCVSWSSDRRNLSYLTGATGTLPESGPRHPTGTIEGTLWIVDRRTPSAPRAIETGLFPLGECPSWSPRAGALAYVVRSSSVWSLVVWRDGQSVAIAERSTASTSYRTFGWAPGSERLVFLDGEALFEWRVGASARLTQEGALADVGAAPPDRFLHSLRFSPNGRLLAVSIGRETAIFTRSGDFVRKVPGTFNGWAGNSGVLTLRAERVITLRLHSVLGPRRSRVIARKFKYRIVTEPSGRWFAYPHESETAGRTRVSFVYFRRPDGSLLRRVRVDAEFFPWVVAGVTGDGRVVEPASAY